jgi:hypothetical protein
MVVKRRMVAFLSQLLLAIRSQFTRRARLEAENLLLRQQLVVLQRKSPGTGLIRPPARSKWATRRPSDLSTRHFERLFFAEETAPNRIVDGQVRTTKQMIGNATGVFHD